MKEQTTIKSTGEVTIQTKIKDVHNVVNVTLRVNDGHIVDMYAKGANGVKFDVQRIKFSLHSEGGDNDECTCCSRNAQGKIECNPCPCED